MFAPLNAYASVGIVPNCDMLVNFPGDGLFDRFEKTLTVIAETNGGSRDQCNGGFLRVVKTDADNTKTVKCLNVESCRSGNVCQVVGANNKIVYKCVEVKAL